MQPIESLCYELEQLMYGHNYEVKLKVHIYAECSSVNEFYKLLRKDYPGAEPENVQLIPTNVSDFLYEINSCLDYRGDEAAGLSLSEKKQIKLTEKQSVYKKYITDIANENSEIFLYPDEEGFYYVVFWNYSFVVRLNDNTWAFIYGSASD